MTGYRNITRMRRTLFWVFAALFLVTWPVLLFYTLGITPARGSDELLTETGAIRIESLPSEARVTFNGTTLEDTTPTVLDRVKPGSHELVLEKDGQRPWRGVVTLGPRLVVRITPAVLPYELGSAPTYLGSLPASDVVLAAEGQYIALVRNSVGAFSIVNAEEESTLSFGDELDAYTDYTVKRVSAHAQDQRFYVWARSGEKRVLLVLTAGSQEGEVEQITSNPRLTDAKLLFQPSLSGEIYAFGANSIYRLEEWSDTTEEQIAADVATASVIEGSLYYLRRDGGVGVVTSIGRDHALFSMPDELPATLSAGGDVRIVHSMDEWISYVTQQDGLVVASAEQAQRHKDLVGGIADSNRERLIVWSRHRFGFLRYPGSEEEAAVSDVSWFGSGHASDGVIRDVAAVAGGTHVLYARNGAVWLQPVLPNVQADPTRIIGLEKETRSWFSEGSGKLIWRTENGMALEKVVADSPLIVLE